MTTPIALALFDLDHTLLDGDGDDLWCRFLVCQGLAGETLLVHNQRMGEAYRAGRVGVRAFSDFYARLPAGRSPAFWAPWQGRFLAGRSVRDCPRGRRRAWPGTGRPGIWRY
jgi:phosphoserine phosphatase